MTKPHANRVVAEVVIAGRAYDVEVRADGRPATLEDFVTALQLAAKAVCEPVEE